MTTGVEYNKIHALAQARKTVMSKFGSNLLYFWPLADPGGLMRDLRRRKPIAANEILGSGLGLPGVTPQVPGMVDYAIDMQTGYITDDIEDRGYEGTSQSGTMGDWAAIVIPAGLWPKVRFRHAATSPIAVHVGVPGIDPSNILSDDLLQVTTTYLGSNLHEAVFPYELRVEQGQYWLYIPDEAGFGVWYSTQSQWLLQKSWNAVSASWDDYTSYAYNVNLYGADGVAWPSYDQFTVGAWVNMDNSPSDPSGAFVICLADGLQAHLYITIQSDKTVYGLVRNTSGTTYSMQSSEPLHPGFNLLTLSFNRNNTVKLGVNGVVVATATPADFGILNTTLALAVGAWKALGGAASFEMTKGIVHDVFMASGVISDSALWDIYMAYITAVPMMQVEGAEKVVLS